MERRTVFFEGQVQGVGFRYTTHRLAATRPVAGYVRNLANGEVELIVEGNGPDLDAFLDALTAKMSGYIARSRVSVSTATGEFDGFGVRH